MPSTRKSESARTNGAKSHGPKTEAGRQRSSQNALKHGLTAQNLLLPTEDPEEFHQLLNSYLDEFHPHGPIERDLVHDMAAAKWRLQRLAFIETQLYIEAIKDAQEYSDDDLNPSESLAQGFQRLAARSAYPFLNRIESRLERTYSRALRNLIQLQHLRQPPDASPPTPGENQICTNEPTDPIQPNSYFALEAAAPEKSPPQPAAIDPLQPTARPSQDAAQPSQPAPQPSAPSHPLATILVYVPRSRAHRHRFTQSQKSGRLVRPAPRLPHQPLLRRQLLRARG
jgi:hypothetical protein